MRICNQKCSSPHINEGRPNLLAARPVFRSSFTLLLLLASFRPRVFLSVLYSHPDVGSELWPQSRQETMGRCCNGKSHLIRDNIKGDFLLSSCPVYLTRCSIQPYAEGQTKSSRCLGNLSRAPWPFWIWAGWSFCSFSYNTQEIVWKHLIRTKHCAQWGLIFNHRSSRWGS